MPGTQDGTWQGAQQGEWREWGARRQRGDGLGCDYRARRWKRQDLVCGVPLQVMQDSGSVGTDRARGHLMGCDGTPGKASGGFRQTQWLLSRFGCLLAHQVMGREARGTLGRGPQAVCSPVQLKAPLAVPGRLPRLGAVGWRPGRGRGREPPGPSGFRRAPDGAARACAQQELREKETAPQCVRIRPEEGLVCRHRSGSIPRRAWCAGTGQDPSRGGPGALAQIRICSEEGLVRRHRSGSVLARAWCAGGAASPTPGLGLFPG